MTVSCSDGIAPLIPARIDVPMNITPTSTPITASVVRAFDASGRWNAGTPFETASTPVIALQPSANARMRSSRPRDSGATMSGVTPLTCGGSPMNARRSPNVMSPSIETRKT
jgi:hypothetical protein